MKRLLLCLAFIGLAAPAWCVSTYWAAQTQAGANDGSSSANAVNITTLNAHTLNPGDTVKFTGGAAITTLITCHDSGASPSNPITYTGDGTAAIYQMNFNGKSNLVIRGLEATQASGTPSNAVFYTSTACSNVVIEDCYVHDTYSSAYQDTFSGFANHVNSLTVRHNSFVNISGTGGGAAQATVITSYGDNLLVEYNYVSKSVDRVTPFGNKAVIRNNYLGATDTFLYPSTPQYPSHTDGGQGFQDATNLTSQSRVLYEKNYDTDNADSVGSAGSPNGHSFTFQYTSTYSLDHVIYRFNLNIREAQSEGFIAGMSNVWLYNWTGSGYATAYATFGGRTNISLSPGQNNGFAFQSGFITDTNVHVINPIWAFIPSLAAGTGNIFAFFITPTSSTYDRMFIYNSSGTYPTNPPGGTNFVTGTDPTFVDGTGAIGHDNYRFAAGSTIKTTSSALTTATSGSTGTSLVVADAHGISDGWGTVSDGDLIKIGTGGTYVRVTAVNYGTNTVTLAGSRTWLNTDPVYVKGMESPGALPYAYAVDFTVSLDNTTLSPGVNSLTTTINNPDAVRGVEYLVDSASVGIVYDSPYTQSYTSAGGTHTVEARALPMWAIAATGTAGAGSQPTMTLSSTKTLSPAASAGAVVISGKVTLGGKIIVQ